jgi:hypothetical protein
VNFVVDPGEMLLRADVEEGWFQRYATALERAPHGLPYVGTSRERGLKLVLGGRRADCHVLGSSRASQLSSVRAGAIGAFCPELVNLWVPGGSLEDVTVLARRFLESGSPRVVLALDPWMLSFDATPGWRSHAARYDEALAWFGIPSAGGLRAPARDQILAAFSLPSFLASLVLVARHRDDLGALYEPPVPTGLEAFDLELGHPRDVTLADGSRVYERRVLADGRRGRLERPANHLVPRAVAFDARAVAQLDTILRRIHDEGREATLLRVPFHPEVFTEAPERVAAYLTPAERILERLAARHGLETRGSFDGRELGCRHGEFKDLRHPLPECLDRIDWSGWQQRTVDRRRRTFRRDDFTGDPRP